MVEMTLAGIAVDGSSRIPVVLLRDPPGRRQVPIWIDHAQAHNILSGLKGSLPNKPQSHDLMLSLLKIGNLKLNKVIINGIEDNSFHAILQIASTNVLTTQSKAKETNLIDVPARTSDAIALAIRSKCKIWMLEKVVAQASIPVDVEADEKDQNDFRRFLDEVSPSDLIKHLKPEQKLEKNPLDETELNDEN